MLHAYSQVTLHASIPRGRGSRREARQHLLALEGRQRERTPPGHRSPQLSWPPLLASGYYERL